ncbi:MAG: calcium-binding protein, partial [Sulfitobacter sp.]
MAIINGTNGNDGSAFYGGAGDDFISLFDGQDFGIGGGGIDTILGGNGDDTFFGRGDFGFFAPGERYDGGSGYDQMWLAGFLSGDPSTNGYSINLNSITISSVEEFRIGTDTGSVSASIDANLLTFSKVQGYVFTDAFQNATFTVNVTGANTNLSGLTVTGFSEQASSHAFYIQGRSVADLITAPNAEGIRIYGNAGNDTLIGGTGKDVNFGGDDNDLMFGLDNDDILIGGSGNDTMYGDAGNDTMYGQNGFDFVAYGGLGVGGVTVDLSSNTSSGIAGVDFIGTDIEGVIGTSSNDNIYGRDQNNELRGGDGDDDIRATGSAVDGGGIINSDTLSGGDGNDLLRGSDGNDDIQGGDGDDFLRGNGGNDTLNGNSGNDLISYLYATGGVTVDLQANSASGADGNDVLISI